MYMILIIFSSIFFCGLTSEIDETAVKFIINLTSSLHSSASFTAFFCIETDNAVKITKKISQYHVMHDIQTSFDNYNFTNFNLQTAHQHFYVIDFECQDAVNLIKSANIKRIFVAPTKWLILNDPSVDIIKDIKIKKQINKKPSLFSVFEKLDIFPDSEVYIGQREIQNNTYKLLSLYRPSQYRNLIIEDRGNWNNINGLVLKNLDPSSKRRQNLQKTPLKSCLVMTNTDTLNHLTDYKDKLVDAVTKVNYPWILHLVNRINATVNFTVRDTWGYKDENGTWSGMIGLLDRGEIDIGGTATFFIPERIGVVDYVQLYTPTGSKFLFRRPPLSYVSNLFTLPFSRSVWIVIIIFLSLVCVLLYITMKWEFNLFIKKNKLENLDNNKTISPTISDNLLVVLGAVSQQGSYYEPRTISTRIVVLMVLFAAMSLYAAYTANIVALLQSTTDSIKTLTDLMNSPLKIGIYDIVYSRHILSTMKEPVRKEFYEKMVKDKEHVWMSLKEGIQKVRQGLFAFHVEVGAGYQLMQELFEEDEKCGINEIDIFNLLNPLLVIKRQSPYRELIRVGAMWIRETGLQKRDIRRLYTEKPTCVGQTSFVSVGITECYAAILTLAYGSALTFGIFIFEIIWRKCFDKNKIDMEQDENEIEADENISEVDLNFLE